ncbi:MAG: 2-phospho-L-lactate guanylyltransferase [Caldilineaceae bacterium]|nr:2-phospho-L-lactate guanylyltransferase [Caldilineaceae bacterium]
MSDTLSTTPSIASSVAPSIAPTHASATEANFALWLVVPVKPFHEAKSRLATALSPALRAELSQRWLTHVLTTAAQWGAQPRDASPGSRLAGIAVISRDPIALTVADALAALPILEDGDDLNSALAQACQVVREEGAEGVLMLPSDLPLLTIEDLDTLYDLALEGEGVIIAPSHDGGTNALLLRPPHAIGFAFGEGSFARHCTMAAAAGLPCHVYQSPTLALDIDHPEDLALAEG